MSFRGSILKLPRRNAAAREVALNAAPVIAISMPKCGTHVLMRLVAALTGKTPATRTLRTTDVAAASQILDQDSDAQNRSLFLRGHQQYTAEIESLLIERGIRVLLILRDPRDTVVSHAHWVTTAKHGSAANRKFYSALPTIEERILVSICGRPAGWNEGEVSADEEHSLAYHGVREDIGRRVQRYVGWLDSPAACVVRFENLIGPDGGGTKSAQIDEISRAAAHLNIDSSTVDPQQIADQLFDPSAKTFRSGRIGGWKEAFDNRHKLVFKSLAGDLLIRLGYEQDFDW